MIRSSGDFGRPPPVASEEALLVLPLPTRSESLLRFVRFARDLAPTRSPHLWRAPRLNAARVPVDCLRHARALLGKVAPLCPEPLLDLPDYCPATRNTQRPGAQR